MTDPVASSLLSPGAGPIAEADDELVKWWIENCDGEYYKHLCREVLRLRAALRSAAQSLQAATERAEQAEQALVSLEMESAQLRGMRDLLSGQPCTPDDQPFGRVAEAKYAKSSSLNFAWTLGWQEAAESEMFKLMVGRADRAMNRSDAAEARAEAADQVRVEALALVEQWRANGYSPACANELASLLTRPPTTK